MNQSIHCDEKQFWGFFSGQLTGLFLLSCIQRITKHECQKVTLVLELGFKLYFILPSATALWEFTVLWEIRMVLTWCIFIRGKIAFLKMSLSSFLLQNWCAKCAGISSREAGTSACHQTWLMPIEGWKWTFWGLSKFSCHHTPLIQHLVDSPVSGSWLLLLVTL